MFQAQSPFLCGQVGGPGLHAWADLSPRLASTGSGLLREAPSGFGWDYSHLNGTGGSAPKEAHYGDGKVMLAICGPDFTAFMGIDKF